MAEDEINERDLKLLIKRANQRILRLERLTGEKGLFSVKELYDYLNVSTLQAITKTGRVSSRTNLTLMQKQAMEKALHQFLESPLSTISGAKEYRRTQEKGLGKKLSLKQAGTIYASHKHYTWIYEYIPKSEFWEFYVKPVQDGTWSLNDWIAKCTESITPVPDLQLRSDLIDLYYYVKD